MQFRLYFLLITSLLIISCAPQSDGKQTEEEGTTTDNDLAIEENLFDEVMVIHDEIMPKMSDLNKLRKELKAQIAIQAESGQDTTTLSNAINELAAAEDGMWDWMHNFRPLGPIRDSLNHDGVLKYLNNEKERITKVKTDMLKSIEQGNQLLNE